MTIGDKVQHKHLNWRGTVVEIAADGVTLSILPDCSDRPQWHDPDQFDIILEQQPIDWTRQDMDRRQARRWTDDQTHPVVLRRIQEQQRGTK